MQSEFSRAGGLPVGHSAKLLCEIGLKAPYKIDEKTSDVGLLGGCGVVESSVWSSERLEAVLLGFWAAFKATSWRFPVSDWVPRVTPASQYPAQLLTTSQAACRRTELDGRGRRLFVHVWHLPMHGSVGVFGDREPSDGALLAELWRVFPPQPSELALPAARRRGFVLSI